MYNDNAQCVYNLRPRTGCNKRKRYEPEIINITNKRIKDESHYFDINDDIWDDFNYYRRIKGIREIIDDNEWVSATKIKNYLLNDPLLDWLDVNKKREYREHKNEKNNGKLSILFEMGNRFEDQVIDYILQSFPDKTTKILQNIEELDQSLMNKTFECMNIGMPFICQAPLYNNQNKTFGVADLLIRSDYVNKLFNQNVLSDTEINIKGQLLDHDYHYIVVDIKWTTMQLCTDGILIRNSGRFPAYKGQLAIYNAALGILQGYTPNKAYILSKAWNINSVSNPNKGFNCFDLLGTINYLDFDKHYIDKTINAIKWIREVRYFGKNWTIDPPSREELYPNMCNKHDSPFHKQKRKIADNINELTQIWMVGIKNRKISHRKKILGWRDKKCNAANLGISGKKIGPIVDKIIKINRDRALPQLLPAKIINNHLNWQTKEDLDFYVDFEAVNGCFYDTDINLADSKKENNLVFMIGVGFEENGAWKYRVFSANALTQNEEKRITSEFTDFIFSKSFENLQKSGQLTKPRLFHWGNAEKTIFNTMNKRHDKIWSSWINSIQWIDFCQICINEPIVIRGAKKFNLKEITKAMFCNGMIKTIWPEDGPETGLDAMIESINYYTFMDKYKLMSNAEKDGIEDEKNRYAASFTKVILYNEIDCKAVWDIVRYLRSHHT